MGGKQRRKKYQKINVDDVTEAREDERVVQKFKKQSTVNNEFFVIDTVGGSKGLPKSVRQALTTEKRPRGFKSMTKESLKQIDRVAEKLDKPKPAEKSAKPSAYDLWDAPAESKVKKPAKIGEKTCKAPAVIVAEPGQAVNPPPKDHENLIFKAAATNIAEENENKDINRRRRPMTHKLIDEFGFQAVKHMSDAEKVQKYHELTRSAHEETPVEGAIVGKKERKTTHQKNKRLRHEERLREESATKKHKVLHKSIAQISSMLREIKTDEEEKKTQKEYVDTMKKLADEEEAKGIITKPKRIGRLSFKEAPIDVPKGKNATLRSVKPTVVVSERINSIYRRNLLEHRSENSRMTLRRMKHRTWKKVKGRKLASSLQRSLLLA
eukprot:GEMP01035458.1.p1 GENE.GEMP01035458.1~~GEMP01035458.1.p1  ORF type:complete len:381 (+),score=95.06 GEMP01035458.1:73-1215(+)